MLDFRLHTCVMSSFVTVCFVMFVCDATTTSADCDFEVKLAKALRNGFEKTVAHPIIIRDAKWHSQFVPDAAFEYKFNNMSVDVTQRLEFQSETGVKPDRITTTFENWRTELISNSSVPYIFQFCHQTLPQGLCDQLLEQTGLPSTMRESSGRLYVSAGKESKGIALHSHEKSWSAIVVGVKDWYVAPPGPPPLEPYRHLDESTLASAGFVHCTQKQGEVVYLPDNWWHATYNRGHWTFAIGGQLDSAGPAYDAARGNIEAIRAKKLVGKHKSASLRLAAIHGHIDILDTLLEKGVNVSAKVGTDDHKGADATHIAAVSGHVPVLTWLLSQGSAVSAKDKRGRTAAHYAAFAGHVEVLQCLLERDMDISMRDYESRTVVHHAASNGHVALLELLVVANAELTATDVEGTHPGHQAALSGHLGVIEYLDGIGVDMSIQDVKGRTVAHHAAVGGHVAVLELLHAAGANLSANDKTGFSISLVAALQGHATVLDMLLMKGIDDILVPDGKGITAVHRAAVKGHTKVIDTLASEGVDVSAKDYAHGMSAILFAASAGHAAVLRLLANRNADTSAADVNGITAGHYAANKGHAVVLQTLLSKGLVDFTMKDKYGSTVVDVAEKRGHVPILEILASAGQGHSSMLEALAPEESHRAANREL